MTLKFQQQLSAAGETGHHWLLQVGDLGKKIDGSLLLHKILTAHDTFLYMQSTSADFGFQVREPKAT